MNGEKIVNIFDLEGCNEPYSPFTFPFFLFPTNLPTITRTINLMLHLVFCLAVWTTIATFVFCKSLNTTKQGINHLKRLHQVPCSNCAYFTGDYRLKCTVNPTIAMSETAIGCRDFLSKEGTRHNNKPQCKITCGDCSTSKKCSEIATSEKTFSLKA